MVRIILKFQDSVLKMVETGQDQITIGRNLKNDIQIDNLAVSSFHARIEKQLGHYFIEDLDSTNGTYVNDRKITKWALKDSDVVSIGKHSLVFMIDQEKNGEAEELRELELDRTMVLDTRRQKELLERSVIDKARKEGKERLGQLTLVEGKASQESFSLTDRVTSIGKAQDAGVRLEGVFAPKIAGFIAHDNRGYSLSRPEKGGKLKLNGRPVESGVLLTEGDLIEIGGTVLRFSWVN